MGWCGNLYLATLLLAAIKDVCGGELPRVWWRPGTAVEEGRTVELQCQVASEGAGPAIWLKLDPLDPNSHVVLSHGDLLITEDPRFSVRHIQNRNVYVVKIREVSKRDAGSYQCQVQVSSETEEQLRVEAAPPLVVTLLTEDVYSSGQSSLTHPPIILLFSLLSMLAGLVR